MPQIFRRSANTLSKVSIFGLLSLVGGLILLAIVLARSSYVTRQHIFVEEFYRHDEGRQRARVLLRRLDLGDGDESRLAADFLHDHQPFAVADIRTAVADALASRTSR